MRLGSFTWSARIAATASFLWAFPACAGDRLVMTGGATQFEGAAGGGIVPWAVLSGYGTAEQDGGSAFATRVDTGDYALSAYGAAFTIRNRVELSYARERFQLDELQRRLSLPVPAFREDVFGAKLRLAGDLVYDRMPQLALGVQYKHQLDFAIPQAVGALRDSGVDVYLSATKLFLGGVEGRNVLVNVTLRATRANQAGLLGFGGDRNDGYSLVAETSVAMQLDPRWAIGVEYRQKPDNLGFAHESDWKDVFVGWFPNKHVAFVLAYADLGTIATLDGQRGPYLSIQVGR